jgi:hypothetical protein
MSFSGDKTAGPRQSPADALFSQITGYYISSAIYAATATGAIDALASGWRSAVEVAEECGCDAEAVRRLLRLLSCAGLVLQDGDGRFELSETGALLVRGRPYSMREVALQFAGPLQQRTWSALEHSVRTGEPAFAQATGTDVFSFFAAHAPAARAFNAAMSFFGSQVGIALADGYDFSTARRVADLGGGNGALLVALLKRHRCLRGILFELPEVAQAARSQLAVAGLERRCEVVAGDLFRDALPRGADVYVLKSVIHDFGDEDAVRILAGCRRAMGAGARLLIVEPMTSARPAPSVLDLRVAGSDMNMLVHLGGRERSEADFRRLCATAGLHVPSIAPLPALPSGMTGSAQIIEAVPAPA